uniref:C2H2-type domain-containing protein n=1 Tax=Heterorhabditis bacteriophora TaxID=37862 RepID=A0A1I7XR23_HETBA
MPSRCELCRINFETSLELEVHDLSLSHHIKLEAKGSEQHSCGICSFTCSTLSEYSKHVDSESHRKKRDRLRAVIDTMDAGENRVVEFFIATHIHNLYLFILMFLAHTYLRMTYPTPNMNNLPTGPPPARTQCYVPSNFSTRCGRDKYNECPPAASSNHHYAKRSGHHEYDSPWNASQLPPYNHGNKECYNRESSSPRFSQQNTDRNYRGRSRTMEKNDRRDRRDEREHHQVEEKNEPLRKKVRSNENPDVEDLPKRGLLARLSLRVKKDKDSLSKSKNKEREKQKCKPSSKNADDTISSTNQPSFEGRAHASEKKTKRKRIVPSQVSMKDRTKKWELVAVKGKASYLKNRSQRMMKDRMSKYRLVDKNGRLVEDIPEEDGQTVSALNHTASVSSAPSHIWGTGPEVHQRDSHNSISMQTETNPLSQTLNTTPSLGVAAINETSIYASMHCELPMSTPRHYGDAVRAYENCSNMSINHSYKTQVLNEVESAVNNIQIPDDLNKASLCGQIGSDVPSIHSSLILEDGSMSSRMDISTANSRTVEVVTIKSELNESPPPETLPSPPQFDQTVRHYSQVSNSKYL